MHVIFRINNPDVVLLGEIIGSTFDVEDLKKNGELELISKTYELGDVYAPVSYTHLDVYKRQLLFMLGNSLLVVRSKNLRT